MLERAVAFLSDHSTALMAFVVVVIAFRARADVTAVLDAAPGERRAADSRVSARLTTLSLFTIVLISLLNRFSDELERMPAFQVVYWVLHGVFMGSSVRNALASWVVLPTLNREACARSGAGKRPEDQA